MQDVVDFISVAESVFFGWVGDVLFEAGLWVLWAYHINLLFLLHVVICRAMYVLVQYYAILVYSQADF